MTVLPSHDKDSIVLHMAVYKILVSLEFCQHIGEVLFGEPVVISEVAISGVM